MKNSRIVALALCLGVSVPTVAAAQGKQGPSELPPVTYSGKQYVDSTGCAFVRGGIDDVVVWIPRRGRDRQMLCGLEPTFSRRATLAPHRHDVAIRSAAVGGTQAAPVSPSSQTSRAERARPATTGGDAPAVLTQQTRVVPAHLWSQRQNARTVTVPRGYRSVWEDDRLNPRRAEQTLAGIAQTRLVWTDTVPRRLVTVPSGHDVTETVALVYPYTDHATQRRDLGTVTLSRKSGKVVKTVRPNPGRVVYSSRSMPQADAAEYLKVRPTPTAPGRYVQVAVFSKKDTAMATAREVQRLGLPVRLKIGERQGERYFTLVAGPFVKERELHAALGRVQKAGFEDAFLRK